MRNLSDTKTSINPTGSPYIPTDVAIPGGKEFRRQVYMAGVQEQWNRENIADAREYEKTSAQMQRFRDAGINPYLALGNISAGNVGAAQGVSQQVNSSADVAEKQVKYDVASKFAGVAVEAEQAAANIDLVRSQANLNNIDAQTRQIENLSRIGVNKGQIRAYELGNSFAADTYANRVKQQESETSIASSQAKEAAASATMKQFEKDLYLMYGQEKTETEINSMAAAGEKAIAEAAAAYKNVELSDKNIELIGAEIATEATKQMLNRAGANAANASAAESRSQVGLNAKLGKQADSNANAAQASADYTNEQKRQYKGLWNITYGTAVQNLRLIKGNVQNVKNQNKAFWPNFGASHLGNVVNGLTSNMRAASGVVPYLVK